MRKLYDDDYDDRHEALMIEYGRKAEEQIVHTFLKKIPIPTMNECIESFTYHIPLENSMTSKISSAFNKCQYNAFVDMWNNNFSEDCVKKYYNMDKDENMQLFYYAVNRIMRKLSHNYKGNKKISYKGDVRIIEAEMVLCNINKTYIEPVWFTL